jgi:hypothetical protein
MPSSRPLEEAARTGDGHRLVHDPFADTEVLVDPLGSFLVVAGDSIGLESQTSGSLDPCQESRQEYGIEGVVCQAPNL